MDTQEVKHSSNLKKMYKLCLKDLEKSESQVQALKKEIQEYS
jgi:hypothetical protein